MYIHDSYIEAGRQLPTRERERYYRALVEFVMFDEEPTLSGASSAIFTAIRPAIELSKKRAKAGSKGGTKRAENMASQDFATKQKPSKNQASNEAKSQVATAIDTYIPITTSTSKRVGGSGEGEPDPKVSEAAEEIVAYLNSKLGTHYKPKSKETLKRISARLREGFTVEDFRTVIDKKTASWQGTDMAQYLRPETLFGTKFEGYLNEIQSKPKTLTEVANERYAKYNR